MEMLELKDAQDAQDEMDRRELDGREVRVVFAKEKRKAPQQMREIELQDSHGGRRYVRDRHGDGDQG